MKTDTKQSTNTEVFTDEVKVIPINKITEKEKKDYTKLVLTQTKSF